MLERLGYDPKKGLYIMDPEELQDKADRYLRRANAYSRFEEREERARLTKKGSRFAKLARWAFRENSDA